MISLFINIIFIINISISISIIIISSITILLLKAFAQRMDAMCTHSCIYKTLCGSEERTKKKKENMTL